MLNSKKAFSSERMYTERILIERLRMSDLKFFKEITGDSLVQKYFSAYRENSKEIEDFFSKEVIKKQSPYDLFLVIRKTDETPIGILNMYFIESGAWLLEYALLEVHRNKGYMTEVLECICSRSEEFLLTFRANTTAINELVFEIPEGNRFSIELINKIKGEFYATCEISKKSFYKMFNDNNTWYRLRI